MFHMVGSIFIFFLLTIALALIWIKESGKYVSPDFIKWLMALAIVMAFIFY